MWTRQGGRMRGGFWFGIETGVALKGAVMGGMMMDYGRSVRQRDRRMIGGWAEVGRRMGGGWRRQSDEESSHDIC